MDIDPGNIADLTPDQLNPNQGTERGQYMLTESVQRLGLGRSVLTDKHGNIISGNKTHAIAGAVGLGETLVVHTTGDRLVVVQRDDLDLSAPTSSLEYQKAREMSIADNQAGYTGLSWAPESFREYQAQGVELDVWFMPAELDEIFTDTPLNYLDDEEADRGTDEGKSVNCVCPKCGERFARLL